ncbi:MAG: PQQ-dependent sugar dehydrogenase [Acidimicrobiales bacterium]
MSGRHRLVIAVVVTCLLATAACRDAGGGPGVEVLATFGFDEGAQPTALAQLADGRLVIGERRTGRILAVPPAVPSAEPQLLATVDVDPDATGQRGLLGLAAIEDTLFASWTRGTDGRLVVGRVAPGPVAVVWEGPSSTELANGGHLAVAPDGRLVIGIGDLQQPDLVVDPSTLNGKVLSLDPEGPSGQRPLVLSGGWNNPFALTVAGGTIWVADNAPGRRPERIGRSEVGTAPVELPGRRAPSALVALGPTRLGLCGFLDGDLVAVDVSGRPTVGDTLARHVCRTGAVALASGSVAVSDGRTVRVLRLRLRPGR